MTATVPATALEQLCINTVRTLSMDAVQQAESGHPGTPMALAPLAWVLWQKHLRVNPANPDWPDRDRFIFSCGHACMLLYSDAVPERVRRLAGRPQAVPSVGQQDAGHSEVGLTPGVETTTGPLGQGVGNAVGMAMAEAQLAALFNRPGHAIVDHYTYFLASDGDLMEGISHEACSLAGHLKLGKLIGMYDDNHITIDGDTDLSFTDDTGKRFEAYGWHVDASGGRQRPGCARCGDPGREARDGPTLDDHCAHAHRLRQPAQAGHRGGAWRAARRRRSEAHEAEPRLAHDRHLPCAARGADALAPDQGARGRTRGRVAQAVGRLPRCTPRSRRRARAPAGRQVARAVGTRTFRCSRPRTHRRRARHRRR